MNFKSINLVLSLFLSLCALSPRVDALTFVIQPGSDIVGAVQTATVQSGETLDDIGQKFDVGVTELIEANPNVDPDDPGAGTALIIPTQFILPSGPRKGIVINLAELRLYYFHPDQKLVSTYPIGVGRPDWETPLGSGRITEKTKDPIWHPPASIRAWYNEHDMYLPEVVVPGPKNPLGKYAMRLSIPGYLIHGTNMAGGIGVRSSSGCIRMHPEDIEALFYRVPMGETVRIVHQPYKIGRFNNHVYAEAHPPLSGDYYHQQSDEEVLTQAIEEANLAGMRFDSRLAKGAFKRSLGYPTLIE